MKKKGEDSHKGNEASKEFYFYSEASGEKDCPDCNGTGYDPLDGGQCDRCNGTGVIDC